MVKSVKVKHLAKVFYMKNCCWVETKRIIVRDGRNYAQKY